MKLFVLDVIDKELDQLANKPGKDADEEDSVLKQSYQDIHHAVRAGKAV